MLKRRDLFVRQCIGLCDDRYQVDLSVQFAHNLHIKRLQGMSGRLNEIHASMDTIIHNVHPVDLVFSIQVCVKSLLNVLDDGIPGFVIVNEVTKARCVNNSQAKTNAILLNISTD